ncbi:hypothetical protein SOVF_049490 isoform B [Spinacia oleracea]|uniref:Uncharacterized protein isoform X2 n=1 Tax=Spinacia oleracea TaxID=3562 RepID=A0ABM3RC65_SPIOL|nr:uncharacterized protein LOC110804220 isoform X2 [Spinacia oleracea]KNA20754.1 hypothetical protein SOVF_049490 isoform B [Spinacia oleracea]
MKYKVVCRKVYDYVRYDLKEIAFPSSLPDPPHIKKRSKLTWKESYYVLKEASRLYAASWVRDIGPELRPNDYKKEEREDKNGVDDNKEREPTTMEDLGCYLFHLIGSFYVKLKQMRSDFENLPWKYLRER